MAKSWLDNSSKVRSGEELNERNLIDFLNEQLDSKSDSIKITQFSKGYSNLTYLVEFDQKEYVLRRPPFGANVKSGHNMQREYKILSALTDHYSKVPKPYFYSDDEDIIGAEFYLMDRVKGVILRSNMESDMIPNPKLMKQISQSMVYTFAELHSIDYETAGLSDLGRPDGYIQRQIGGWTKRYNNAKTDDVKSIDYLADWLAANMPTTQRATLIHNDYKYDNLVLDESDWSKVNAVLDWEMTTLGDPLMDLGTTIGYWINHDDPEWMKQLALSPTTLPGNPRRGELVEIYAQASGNDISEILFYYIYGLFKIAGITQQIYYRYKNGHTDDPRFASLNKVVEGLGAIGMSAIKSNKLDDLF